MADIVIPGDELVKARTALDEVLTFIDSERIPGDLESMLGPGTLSESARSFDRRWEDGRVQLKKECGQVRKAIGEIEDSFSRTDLDSGRSLEGAQ